MMSQYCRHLKSFEESYLQKSGKKLVLKREKTREQTQAEKICIIDVLYSKPGSARPHQSDEKRSLGKGIRIHSNYGVMVMGIGFSSEQN